MPCLEERVLVVIVESTKLNAAKVFHEILFAHEEFSIIFIVPSCDSFRIWRPAVTIIAPVTFPLEITPRVAQLIESYAVSESVLDFDTSQQAIRVISNEAELLKCFDRCFCRASTRSHDPLFLVCHFYFIPEAFVAGFDNFGGSTCKITQNVFREAGFNALVTAV